MSLSNANIDLMAEKTELDAFLSKCLEIEVREEAPQLSPQPQEPEPVQVEPVLKPEPAEIPEPAAGEVPSAQAAAPVESKPEVEISEYFKPEIRTEEIKPVVPEVTAEALQPDAEAARTDFSPGDPPKPVDFTEQPQAAPVATAQAVPETSPEPEQAKPEALREIPAELRSPYLDKSSLRKPSKNVGAMSYAREKEKNNKRLFIVVGIFVAFLIGVAIYLYMFPIGNRSTEIISGKPSVSGPVSGSIQEQKPARAVDSAGTPTVDAKTDDAKAEENKQIHKKINRGT